MKHVTYLKYFALNAFFRMYIALLPYAYYKKEMDAVDAPLAPKGYVKWVGAWVFITSKHVPHSTCLSRAMTARFILRRRGFGSVIRVGIAQENERVTAHAWLVSGETIVVGDESDQLKSYKVITDLGREH
jgi:hypothetical protein